MIGRRGFLAAVAFREKAGAKCCRCKRTVAGCSCSYCYCGGGGKFRMVDAKSRWEASSWRVSNAARRGLVAGEMTKIDSALGLVYLFSSTARHEKKLLSKVLASKALYAKQPPGSAASVVYMAFQPYGARRYVGQTGVPAPLRLQTHWRGSVAANKTCFCRENKGGLHRFSFAEVAQGLRTAQQRLSAESIYTGYSKADQNTQKGVDRSIGRNRYFHSFRLVAGERSNKLASQRPVGNTRLCDELKMVRKIFRNASPCKNALLMPRLAREGRAPGYIKKSVIQLNPQRTRGLCRKAYQTLNIENFAIFNENLASCRPGIGFIKPAAIELSLSHRNVCGEFRPLETASKAAFRRAEVSRGFKVRIKSKKDKNLENMRNKKKIKCSCSYLLQKCPFLGRIKGHACATLDDFRHHFNIGGWGAKSRFAPTTQGLGYELDLLTKKIETRTKIDLAKHELTSR